MLLLLTLLSLCLGWRPSWMPPIHDTDCTFERADSYQCLKKYVDVHPKDDQITKVEIDEAIAKYLPTYLKPVLWWVGTEGVMDSCDVDKNGVITPRDWEMSSKTCFPIKESQCTVQWFCKRIEDDQKK